MDIVKGFPATSQDHFQLNVTNIIKQAVQSFAKQEIASRKHDGTIFRYTYGDAYNRMGKLANALKELGVRTGDRVGVLAWNTHENYEIYFGVPGMGAVMLMLNLRLAPPDLSYVINHAGASVIIVDETLLPIAQAIVSLCPNVKTFIVITAKSIDNFADKLPNVVSYEDILAKADSQFPWPNLDEKSAYAACYTTGTTGKPKGVYYSHRNVYLHSCSIALNAEIALRDTVLQIVPMFHALGWGLSQASTMVGARQVFSGMYTLDKLGTLAELFVNEKVSVSAGAPAIFMPFLEYIRKLDPKPDLTGVRLLSGATEPPIAMMKGFAELTGAEVIHAYGATETTPLVTINRIKPWMESTISEEDRWDRKRKQGYCVNGLDLKVVDLSENPVPNDGKTAGELLIRGPWITGSYHEAPGSEAQFTADGYWRSGDVATIDEEGYVKITDRVKDVIKSGGEWISSVDMENEIISHPAVLEAAVVGVAHPKWQERPIALVVLRPEGRGKINVEDIREHLAAKFAKWQLPEAVFFVDTIPKTSVGKINKKVIREDYKETYASQTEIPPVGHSRT
ncbi:long-chain-fatty-acid--CoA ligase [Desulfomonile tiedjei]|uniref:Acyl-CoA synthetase (AMP-forming)/AMP-acid ligase II n=1 Tax=Desulfomonile tiedjei (strain ATCC 49306 / DSM 6799 / DCB-1) TaxID=706587 RepID=I4C8M6_DESTA|nr:long-chain-fatty-acid--CoA ligase [Desulfomonile tiedjei]AFM25917.1 acyl-CoA synthetase (AMP-forming)/AMP-acid ligase II [Desulfomonile tiedjei DSM 6799]